MDGSGHPPRSNKGAHVRKRTETYCHFSPQKQISEEKLEDFAKKLLKAPHQRSPSGRIRGTPPTPSHREA